VLCDLAGSGFELSEIREIEARQNGFWLTPSDVRFLRSCGVRADSEDVLAEVCKQRALAGRE